MLTFIIKGTHSKGTLEKADTKPRREINKIILLSGGIRLFLTGILLHRLFINRMSSRSSG